MEQKGILAVHTSALLACQLKLREPTLLLFFLSLNAGLSLTRKYRILVSL